MYKRQAYIEAKKKGEIEEWKELAYCKIDGQLSAQTSTIAFLAEKNGISVDIQRAYISNTETVTIAIDSRKKGRKRRAKDQEQIAVLEADPNLDNNTKAPLLAKLRSDYITEYEEDVLMVNKVFAKATAQSLDGDIAYGAAVTARVSSPYFITTACAKAQRQAMEQLIPQNEIKYAFWQSDGAEKYQPPLMLNHYQRCLDLKEEIDTTMSVVNYFTFWKWVTSLYTNKQLEELQLLGINSWSLFEQEEQEACKLAAWLTYYKESNDDLPF